MRFIENETPEFNYGEPCLYCGYDIENDNHICNTNLTKKEREESEIYHNGGKYRTLYDLFCM